MPYYLGIDGGGTKTTCAVGDGTRLLATALGGPSNIVRVGELQTRESLQQAVSQACAAAGIAPAQIAHACIGGAGAAHPEMAAKVRGILASILPAPIEVVGDMHAALEAAFDMGPGVIVNAGTGSFAYGRDPQGNTLRAGGWGFAVGDEGSAHWIGRAAVNAVLRAADRSGEAPKSTSAVDDSSLAAALTMTWRVGSLADLARAGNAIPPPNFAALFPAVAASPDSLAKEILTEAGRELAELAAIVARRLFPPAGTASVPVATTGGVFRYAPLVRQVFYNELRALDARTQVNPEIVEPVEGALRLARRATRK